MPDRKDGTEGVGLSNHYRHWQPEDGGIIRSLSMWYTAAEIGRLLGRTTKAVQRFCWRNGIKLPWHLSYQLPRSPYRFRKWAPAEWNKAVKLSERHSISEVAHILNRSRFSVWAKFQHEGLRFGQGRYTASFVARLCSCSVPHTCRAARRLDLNRSGKGCGSRYKLTGDEVRRLVKEIRPGRLYRCEGL